MIKKFVYGNYQYQYQLIKQKRKSLSLTIKPSKEIVVKGPLDIDLYKVEQFLKRKWFWMNKQLDFFDRVNKKEYKREYVSGESLLYLGRQYKLVVKSAKADSICLFRGVFEVRTSKSVKNSSYTKILIDRWYKEKTVVVFEDRFEKMKKLFPKNNDLVLELRNMSKRWGSFLKGKKVSLNPKLIHASKDCIDYVLIHELCHIKYRKHNKLFFACLDKKLPNWKKVKEKLEYKYS
ncbi:MAG: SprT family zinc-dependent metalloprotease [Candidatus Doudnabacteria bacterium]